MILYVLVVLLEFFLLIAANQFQQNTSRILIVQKLNKTQARAVGRQQASPPRLSHLPMFEPFVRQTATNISRRNRDRTDTVRKIYPKRRQDSNDLELLCKLTLYTSSMTRGNRSETTTSITESDDRLIFLIPLVIIYWHHRHPHEPLPLRDLELLLQQYDDGEQSKAIREMNSIIGEQRRCLDTPLGQQLRLEDTNSRQDQLRLEKSLMDLEQEHGALPTNYAPADNILRGQSGVRELRQWLNALLGTRRRKSAKKQTAKVQNVTTATTTTAPTTGYMAHGMSEETTTLNSLLPPEYFAINQSLIQLSTTSKPMAPTEALDESLNITLSLRNSSSESSLDSQFTPTATDHDTGLYESGKDTNRGNRDGEFLNIISSIMTDFDQIYNSTGILDF